jgi:5-methylcytosine-specific restriction endonuclease McrA
VAKERKKAVREAFHQAVFRRDGGKCVVCRQSGRDTPAVDAHHITDRTEIPNGGYVLENGIAVCEACHLRVEQYHLTGQAEEGLHPDDLYRLIGSSYDAAVAASAKSAPFPR